MEHGITTSNTCAHFYSVDEFKTNHSFVFKFLHELLSPSSRTPDSLCHSLLVLMLKSSDLPHRQFSEDKEELFFFLFLPVRATRDSASNQPQESILPVLHERVHGAGGRQKSRCRDVCAAYVGKSAWVVGEALCVCVCVCE